MLKEAKIKIDKLRKLEHQIDNIFFEQVSEDKRWFWQMLAEELYTTKPKQEIEKRMKRNAFLVASLERPQRLSKTSGVTEQDILMAKEVPIDTMVDVNRGGFAICLLHKEKTASLKVYDKTNTWHCFGCNASGDSIDLVQKLRDLEFIEAVKILINK